MTTSVDFGRSIKAWLDDEAIAGPPDRLAATVSDRIDRVRQRRRGWFGRALAGSGGLARMAAFTAATAAIVVVAVVATTLLSSWDGSGGPGASIAATGSPEASPPSGAVLPEALPPEGSTPSDPRAGDLVIRYEANVSARISLWVYADGRVVRAGWGGLVEQRLTRDGLEALLASVRSSGLFESDLVLAREGPAPHLGAQVRDGDRVVNLTWAWRGIAGSAPVATTEQRAALEALDALLARPGSWPEAGWADATASAYVPSWYSICFGVQRRGGEAGVWPRVDPARVLELLPRATRDLIGTGVSAATERDAGGGHGNGGCTRVRTQLARDIALSLEDAGLSAVDPTAPWLAYELVDPSGAWEPVWMQFAPVLPHGGAGWLGPG